MRRHWWFAGIALSALGLFSGLWANNQPTTVSPEQIAKLIAQLGAPTFQEREQASKALEAIGEAALPALKEAAEKSTDAEIKRRASDLVRTLENKLHAEKLRQPTLISVAYHNTPLVEVLRDLTAKTGVPFEPRLAADRQAELSRKLVTLRLDQKPLWQVVDEVLAACGLRQAEPRSDVLPQVFDLEEGQLDKSKIHYSGVARVRRLSRPLPESKAEDGNRPVASETISFEVSLEPQRFIAEGQLTPVEVQLVDENGHVLKATASLVPSDQPPDKKADAAEDGAIFLQVQGGVVIANARVIAPGLRPREPRWRLVAQVGVPRSALEKAVRLRGSFDLRALSQDELVIPNPLEAPRKVYGDPNRFQVRLIQAKRDGQQVILALEFMQALQPNQGRVHANPALFQDRDFRLLDENGRPYPLVGRGANVTIVNNVISQQMMLTFHLPNDNSKVDRFVVASYLPNMLQIPFEFQLAARK